MGSGHERAWCSALVAPTVEAEGEQEASEAGVEGEQAGEEANVEDEAEIQCDECEPMRRAPRPYQPTLKEVELHNETHYPYRSG
jgi:hypothetical protein